MVIGTNSLLTGIPSVGCGEEETIQCITAQLGYSTAVKTACCEVTRRSGPSPAGLLCSALLGSAACQSVLLCTGLLHSAAFYSGQHLSAPLCHGETSLLFQFSQGDAVSLQSSVERPSTLSQPEESWLIGTKSPSPVPDLSVFLQMRTPNHHSLMGPKGTILIDQNRTTLVVWIYAVLIEWGKPQTSWLEKDSGNSFIRTG